MTTLVNEDKARAILIEISRAFGLDPGLVQTTKLNRHVNQARIQIAGRLRDELRWSVRATGFFLYVSPRSICTLLEKYDEGQPDSVTRLRALLREAQKEIRQLKEAAA